jgi:hypothetical protein
MGGLLFIERVAAGNLGPVELGEWIEEHLVSVGRMPRPASVSQPGVGTFHLEPPADPATTPPQCSLAELLAAVRTKVVAAVRGMIMTPPDDRFLAAAIFKERVERVRVGDKMAWVARPRVDDALSDIVLSLFAADVLGNREVYEQRLCVCEICGRVSFAEAAAVPRWGCTEHKPREGMTFSGFMRAVVPEDEEPDE